MTPAPCPCGKVPTKLVITCEDRGKYGYVGGDCCNEWQIEFRNQYCQHRTQEQSIRAEAAWSSAPRGAPILNRTLVSLKEFNERKRRTPAMGAYPRRNGIACPECRAELMDSDSMVLVSFPAQRNVHCSSCSYKGCRLA